MSTDSTQISEREREILRLVAMGATNQQIAHQLNISINTVKVHLRNIFAKINVASRTEATVYAIQQGLVQLDTPPTIAETDAEEPLPALSQPETAEPEAPQTQVEIAPVSEPIPVVSEPATPAPQNQVEIAPASEPVPVASVPAVPQAEPSAPNTASTNNPPSKPAISPIWLVLSAIVILAVVAIGSYNLASRNAATPQPTVQPSQSSSELR
jgi:DNA-binding CsgD family transcriptional regulator